MLNGCFDAFLSVSSAKVVERYDFARSVLLFLLSFSVGAYGPVVLLDSCCPDVRSHFYFALMSAPLLIARTGGSLLVYKVNQLLAAVPEEYMPIATKLLQ